jgi:hypothetical protein
MQCRENHANKAANWSSNPNGASVRIARRFSIHALTFVDLRDSRECSPAEDWPQCDRDSARCRLRRRKTDEKSVLPIRNPRSAIRNCKLQLR